MVVAVFDRDWQYKPFHILSWPFITHLDNDVSSMMVGIGRLTFDCCHIVIASDDDNGEFIGV